MGNLAVIEALEHKWDAAWERQTDCIRLLAAQLGPRHPELVRPYLNLARVHLARHEWAQAYESAAKARAVSMSSLYTAAALRLSATALRKLGRKTEARELEREARGLAGTVDLGGRVHVSDLVR